MVERGKAPPKPGIPNPGRGGNRIVEEKPATGNNRNQGKCLGTKLGTLHYYYLQTETSIWYKDLVHDHFLTSYPDGDLARGFGVSGPGYRAGHPRGPTIHARRAIVRGGGI